MLYCSLVVCIKESTRFFYRACSLLLILLYCVFSIVFWKSMLGCVWSSFFIYLFLFVNVLYNSHFVMIGSKLVYPLLSY